MFYNLEGRANRMGDSVESLLEWVRSTFQVVIEPIDLYSPSERQRVLEDLRRIAAEVLDVACPEVNSVGELVGFIAKTVGISTTNGKDIATDKEQLRLLLRMLLGCAVTSFQESAEKKQSYVVQILEIEDTQDNTVKNQLKLEIEAFNKMANATLSEDSFDCLEQAMLQRQGGIKREFKLRESQLLEQIKDLEETVLELKVQLDDSRSIIAVNEEKCSHLTEALEIAQEHERTSAQREEVIQRLKSKVEQLNGVIEAQQEESSESEVTLAKELEKARDGEHKLREDIIRLKAMNEEKIRQNGLLNSQLDNSTAKSLQLELELSKLQLEAKELHVQVHELQEKQQKKSPIKAAALHDEITEANMRQRRTSEVQCEILAPDALVLQKLKTQELAQLNGKLSDQICELEREVVELKASVETERTTWSQKEKALTEEMKEWEEYSQKLEGDLEKLETSQKTLTKTKEELALEAEFWTKKTEESHAQFSDLANQLKLLQNRHNERERAVAEDCDAWRLKYYSRKALFEAKYGKLLSKAKAHRETEVNSRKQMKRLLAKKDQELSYINGSLEQLQKELSRSHFKQLALKAAQHLTIQAEVETRVNLHLAEYVKSEGVEISDLIGKISDKVDGNDVLSALVATPTEIDQKLNKEQRAMQEKIERLTREIEWLREQQRHANLQHSGDSSLFHVKNEEPPTNVSHLTALVAQLEVEKRAISAAKYAEIEKRIEAESRIKYLEIENDKLKLRSTHTSGSEKHAPISSKSVSNNWFTIAPVSKSVVYSPPRQQVFSKGRSCSADGKHRVLARSASRPQISTLTPPSDTDKENSDSNTTMSSSATKTFRIRYSGDKSIRPLRTSR